MARLISTILSLRDNMSGGLLRIARNTQGVTREMRAATRDVLRFRDRVSHALAGAVKTTAKIGLTVGAGFATYAVKSGAAFEAQMRKVQAISGASADNAVRLANAAKKMGATTRFSATESGQALEYMAMAGWQTDQMLAGLPHVLHLAAASGEDLGLVSDIVTDALTAFGLQATDTGRFVDVLAAAATNSNTNVSMMGETFKYAAPLAGALGFSVEDTAVAIGLMANASIKADQAGTSLRGLLTNLAKPSKENLKYINKLGISLTDSFGKVKPLSTLLGEFREKFRGLTEAQKTQYAAGIAGKNAMSGFLAMLNGSDEDFLRLTQAIAGADDNNTAENIANVMDDTLLGQLKLLKSSLEGIGITFYEAVGDKAKDATKNAIEWLTKLQEDGTIARWASRAGEAFDRFIAYAGKAFRWIQANSKQIKTAIVAIGIAFMAMKGIQFVGNIARVCNDLSLFGQTVGIIAGNGLPKLFGMLTKIGGGMLGIIKAIGAFAMAHPFLALIGVTAVLVYKNWDKIKPLFIIFGEKLRVVWEALKVLGAALAAKFRDIWQWMLTSIDRMKQWFRATVDSIKAWWSGVKAWFSSVKDAIVNWVGSVRDSAVAIKDRFVDAFGRIKEAIVGAFQAAKDKIAGFFGWMDDKISNIPLIGKLYGGAKNIAGNVISWGKAKIGANANGTHYWGGGLTRVHERGGEIINLPSGTQIIPHDLSKQAIGGQPINIHLNIQGNLIGNEQVADMIGEIIAGKIKLALANT